MAVSIFHINLKRKNYKKSQSDLVEEGKSEDNVEIVKQSPPKSNKSPSAKSTGFTSRISKQCFIEKCNRKSIDGKNWAIHYKKTQKLNAESLDHSEYDL